jgi:hypothetical protein
MKETAKEIWPFLFTHFKATILDNSRYLTNHDGIVSVFPEPFYLMTLSVYIKGVRNFEMIDSHIIIECIPERTSATKALWSFETDLEPRAYTLRLTNVIAYRLTVSRVGFASVTEFVSPHSSNLNIAIMMDKA